MNCVQKSPRKRGLKTIPSELTEVSFSVGFAARFVIGTLESVVLGAAQKINAAAGDLENGMTLIEAERDELVEEIDHGRFLQQAGLGETERIENLTAFLIVEKIGERNLQSFGELADDFNGWVALLVFNSADKGRRHPRAVFELLDGQVT